MRLFLDANILFTAAHNSKGKAALVIELGQAGLWQLVTSTYALEEARRNLALKFPDGLERLDALAQGLRISPDAAPRTARPDCQRRTVPSIAPHTPARRMSCLPAISAISGF